MTFRSAACSLGILALLASPALSAGIVRNDNLQIDTRIIKSTALTALPMAIVGKGCTFYEHPNGQGAAWNKAVGWLAERRSTQDSYAEYVTYTGEWWDDRISSMRCDESETVRCSIAVYPERNKGGREAIFWGSQGLFNLSDWGYDDTISSFLIFCNHMK